MSKTTDSYKILLKEELKKIVENLKNNYDPEKIILFGSLADGKMKKGSDIDLLIIKQTQDDPWTRTKKADRCIEHHIPVDVLVYTPQEIEDRLSMNDFFVEDIMERGTVLYERQL